MSKVLVVAISLFALLALSAPRMNIALVPVYVPMEASDAVARKMGTFGNFDWYVYTIPDIPEKDGVIDRGQLITALEFAIAWHQQNQRLDPQWQSWDAYWIGVYKDAIRVIRMGQVKGETP